MHVESEKTQSPRIGVHVLMSLSPPFLLLVFFLSPLIFWPFFPFLIWVLSFLFPSSGMLMRVAGHWRRDIDVLSFPFAIVSILSAFLPFILRQN